MLDAIVAHDSNLSTRSVAFLVLGPPNVVLAAVRYWFLFNRRGSRKYGRHDP